MRALAALVLLSAFAPSQDKVSIPANSLMIVELDGPGKIHSVFADTRLARMLANPRMSGVLMPVTMGVEMGIQALEQQTGEDIELLYEGLREYSGRISVGFTFLSQDLAAMVAGEPQFGVVLAMKPDGQTDLGAIAESIMELVEQDPDSGLEDLQVDGQTYSVYLDGDGGFTMPMMLGDDLVILAGEPLEDAISLFLNGREQDSFNASDEFAAAPLAVHLDLGGLMSLVMDLALASNSGGPMEADLVTGLLEAMGLSSLGAADIMVGAEDEHVVMDFGMDLKPGNRGFLDLYVPERTGPPAALNLIPRQAASWSVQPVGMDKAYGVLTDVLDVVGTASGISLEQIEAQVEMATGLRLEQDILNQLGDAVITVGDESAFAASVAGAVAGTVYGATVKDAAAMTRTMDTLLTRLNMREMLETDEYRGFDVHSLFIPPLSMQYTITDRLILLGFGEGSDRLLRAVVDQEVRVRDGEAPGDFPDGITERLELAPRGWSMVSYLRAIDMVNGIISVVEETAEVPLQMGQMAELLLGLLKDFDLEDVVAAGSLQNGKLRYRLIW